MRLLLSGSSGVIGAQVKRLLLELGHEVTCVTRPDSIDPVGIPIYPWTPLQGLSDIDAAVHLANFYPRKELSTNTVELFDVNVGLAVSLASFCGTYGVPVVSVGSYLECHPKRPWTLYTESKIMSRKVFRASAVQFEFSHLHLYVYDTYGFDLRRGKFIDTLLSWNSLDPIVASNAKHLQDLTFVEDVAHAICKGVELVTQSETIHQDRQVRSYEVLSLKQVVELVNAYSPRKIDVHWNADQQRRPAILNLWDCDSLLEGWKPTMSIDTFIGEWFKGNSFKV